MEDGRQREDLKQFGRRIAERRRELRLSQAALAERMGWSAGEMVSRYERGDQDPKLSTLLRLAEVLKVPAGDLVTVPPPSPSANASGMGEQAAALVAEIADVDVGIARVVMASLRGAAEEIRAGRAGAKEEERNAGAHGGPAAS